MKKEINESEYRPIPPQLAREIDEGREILEVADTGVADTIARRFAYRIERFSERRDAWLLVKRKQ